MEVSSSFLYGTKLSTDPPRKTMYSGVDSNNNKKEKRQRSKPSQKKTQILNPTPLLTSAPRRRKRGFYNPDPQPPTINRSPSPVPDNSSPEAKRNSEIYKFTKMTVNLNNKENLFPSSVSQNKDTLSDKTEGVLPEYQITDYLPTNSDELNSSPLKNYAMDRFFHNTNISSSPSKSSPTKARKRVAFSDDLFLDQQPSSPVSMQQTPIKSILKMSSPSLGHSAHSLKTFDSSNPESWLPGSIIQLKKNSNELSSFLKGCIGVLSSESFDRRFEVYASLNHVFKTNTAEVLLNTINGLGPDQVNKLTTYIQRDVINMELRVFDENISDPFSSRAVVQALKLMNQFTSTLELNNLVDMKVSRWVIEHSCEMITNIKISKSLISPYLQILKDSKLHLAKRILTAEMSEKMLYSLINMTFFPSSSISIERMITLRYFVNNFPTMMAKNFNSWFPWLIVNLLDLNNSLYLKIMNTGVITLMEVAKNFMDNKNVNFNVWLMLSKPVPNNIRTISDCSLKEDQTGFQLITSKIEELISNEQYKFAMDIWLSITLLVNASKGIQKWDHIQDWLKVHKRCFNETNTIAKVTALRSWKCMVYNLCKDINYKQDDLKSRFKLLIHPILNIVDLVDQKEIVDVLHNLFLAIVYHLLTPINSNIKQLIKQFGFIWDRVIQPVLSGFYFSKHSSAYMHELGLKLINKLLKNNSIVTEKKYNSMRCLGNDAIQLNELPSLNPRWIFLNYDVFIKNLNVIFRLGTFSTDVKTDLFMTFLNNLKMVTKRETKLSNHSTYIINDIPFICETLFKHNKISVDSSYKILINLNDTFGSTNLIDLKNSKNIFSAILPSVLDFETTDLIEFLRFVMTSLGKKDILFIAELCAVDHLNESADEFVNNYITNKTFAKLTTSELAYYGKLFSRMNSNYENTLKKLIQSILNNEGELVRSLQALDIAGWSLNCFNFFILLMHDAPAILKQFTLNVLLVRWERNEEFFGILNFLVERKFDFELYNLRSQIFKKLTLLTEDEAIKFDSLWTEYLFDVCQRGHYLLVDDFLVSSYGSKFNCKRILKSQLRLFRKYEALLFDENRHDLIDIGNSSVLVEVDDSQILPDTQMVDQDDNDNVLGELEAENSRLDSSDSEQYEDASMDTAKSHEDEYKPIEPGSENSDDVEYHESLQSPINDEDEYNHHHDLTMVDTQLIQDTEIKTISPGESDIVQTEASRLPERSTNVLSVQELIDNISNEDEEIVLPSNVEESSREIDERSNSDVLDIQNVQVLIEGEEVDDSIPQIKDTDVIGNSADPHNVEVVAQAEASYGSQEIQVVLEGAEENKIYEVLQQAEEVEEEEVDVIENLENDFQFPPVLIQESEEELTPDPVDVEEPRTEESHSTQVTIIPLEGDDSTPSKGKSKKEFNLSDSLESAKTQPSTISDSLEEKIDTMSSNENDDAVHVAVGSVIFSDNEMDEISNSVLSNQQSMEMLAYESKDVSSNELQRNYTGELEIQATISSQTMYPEVGRKRSLESEIEESTSKKHKSCPGLSRESLKQFKSDILSMIQSGSPIGPTRHDESFINEDISNEFNNEVEEPDSPEFERLKPSSPIDTSSPTSLQIEASKEVKTGSVDIGANPFYEPNDRNGFNVATQPYFNSFVDSSMTEISPDKRAIDYFHNQKPIIAEGDIAIETTVDKLDRLSEMIGGFSSSDISGLSECKKKTLRKELLSFMLRLDE